MPRLIVFNTDEKPVAILENKDGSNACPFYDATFTEQLNGQITFEFQTISTHRDAKLLTAGNKVGFWLDGEFLLFEITKPNDEHGEGIIKTVVCEHVAITELNVDRVKDKRPENVTADVALSGILTDTILGGSRWKKGNIAALGTATPENIYYESPLAGVQKIITAYKTDYKPRLVVSGTKITDRFIDLGPRGSDTGRRFEYTKDIKQIKREVDIEGVRTALVGRGKGEETGDGYGRRITFESVVWTTGAGNPANKPLNMEYVGDDNARILYGLSDGAGGKRHRLGDVEFPDDTDPAVLLQKTWDHLQTINKPRVTYSMTVIDLAALTGLDHQKVKLGDTVGVIDRDLGITIRARVIEIKRTLGEPEKTEIILGNFIPYFTDESLKLDTIERKLNDKAGIWDNKEIPPITNGDFADTIPPAPANVTATGLFRTISVDWTFENDVTISQYEVYGSKNGSFIPDTTGGSNLLFRGLAGAFVHKAAVNEVWYFFVRAINRSGNPGPWSPQVSARTLQVKAEDITPQVITNELIAADAEIDFAKIANVIITNGHIDNFTWDKGEGGMITLGGPNNGNGRMVVLDANGESIADLDAQRGGFDRLHVGDFTSPTVERVNRVNFNLFVDPAFGSDNNDGSSWGSPKKTINSALDMIPKMNYAIVNVFVHYDNGRNIYENVVISNFHGSGDIVIDFQTQLNRLNGTVLIKGCTNNIELRNGTINSNSQTGAAIFADRCQYVAMISMVVFGNNVAYAAYAFGGGTNAKVWHSTAWNVVDAVRSESNSRVYIDNCDGLGSSTGLVAVDTGTIMGYGSAFAGAAQNIYEERGGDVLSAFSFPSAPVPPTPPPPPETKKTIETNTGDNWSDSYMSWQGASDGVKQGNYGYGNRRGLWFFGTSILDNIGGGRTIKAVRLYIQRANKSGSSGAVRHSIRLHGYASKPAGQPSLSNEVGSISLGWGQDGWINIDSGYWAGIANGTYRGFGIFSDDGSNYSQCTTYAAVEIVYQ